MATLLLIVIYIAFISLGIPDSLLGAAWPAIYVEFNLPVSFANFLSVLISVCTMISSVVSARLINRYGTAVVAAFSTALTAIALFGFSVSENFLWLCLFSIPLGAGAGAIDSGLNNYVALHYKATHMSFLHCFYGVGVSMSPYLMSMALADNSDWHKGYRSAFYIQLVIAAIVIFTLPLWKKVKHSATQYDEEPQVTVPFFTLVRRSDIRAAAMVFLASCSIEFLCGVWGSTFLVGARGLNPENAAKSVTFYYVGITLGRFLSGVVSNRLAPRQIIAAGQIVTLAAVVLLFVGKNPSVSTVGLFLVGTGNGTIYPNMMYLTPENFGADISQSVMGVQLAGAYVGILVSPFVFGIFAEYVGLWLFPVFICVFFVLMLYYTAALKKRTAKFKKETAKSE
ncbi:MAG: MFS transporter [Oscillospiraceae bacterium]|nr:MFS transporter [Oscillospiraceae bacterium]